MIAFLSGTVQAVRADSLILLGGSVGHLVYLPASQLAEVRSGQELQLHTSLVVREDSMTLYGFMDEASRGVFETLQTISGIGPRLALAMLSVLTPQEIHRAVADADLTALQRVPGVGKKSAQRLVLELGTKLGALQAAAPAGLPGIAPAGAADSVVEALTGLGWPQAKAAEVVAAAQQDLGEASTQDLLRESLKRMNRAS